MYGTWKFPGGKLEAGETEHQCLQRELQEEFGIQSQIGKYLASSFFEYNQTSYEMRAYIVPSFQRALCLLEHQAVSWVDPSELINIDMPDADKPIMEKLLEQKGNSAKTNFFDL